VIFGDCAAAVGALAHIANLSYMAHWLAAWANAQTGRIPSTKVGLLVNPADIPSRRTPYNRSAAPTELKKKRMNTLIDVAVADGHFHTLAKALTAAGLVDTLKAAGPFTVFAPTSDAFAKLPAGALDGLLNDIPKLTAILKYHVLAGKVAAADVVTLDGKTAKTLSGGDLKVSTKGGFKRNGEGNVTKTDVAASNGLIHVIDAVLPPSA
jgi:uncharacterized surface protein with fasciclin (FAS1) repeats